ncbi:MAG: carboxypeptidase regulatory-like domain-containing protein [Candidatus Latescibacteria bacterium]|nr:carboxypeptidase regulatory-like domain-containing protein [Candidatus Latescibacterota bacterium]
MRKFFQWLLLGGVVAFFLCSGYTYVFSYTAVTVTNGGTISGTVTYVGTAQAPKVIQINKDVEVCGKEPHHDQSLVVGANKGVADVIVSITNVQQGKGVDALGATFTIDQRVCVYRPHVQIIPVNAPVKILNNDGILHNIHTFSVKNPPFNKAQPKFKKEMTETFKVPELVPVKCDAHGWMSAYLKVVDHPYHAVTDANGKYTIKDVPPGTYTVEFWQETLKTQTKQVTVQAGATATLDLQYPAK